MKRPGQHRLLIGVLLVVVIGGAAIAGSIFFGNHRSSPQVQATPTSAAISPTSAVDTTSPTAKGQVISYEQEAGAVKSSIGLKANGQNIFVEKYENISYARFAFSGAVDLAVTDPAGAAFTISPRSYGIQASQSGTTTTFTLTQPRNLILQSSSEKLFIFADPPEQNAPRLGAANVLDVTKYVTDSRGDTEQTSNIQRGINDAGKRHAILYFPRGTYLSGTLNIVNNASVYLSSGALLLGTGKAGDYSGGHFIVFNGSHNARIFGRGTLDLRGFQMRKSSGDAGRIKLIRTVNASNIQIDDLLLRDSGSWTVHITGSDTVSIQNIKLINYLDNTNNDGIDPDSSTHVTINGPFIYTNDDCFAVKTSGDIGTLQQTNDVLIEHAVCYDKKSALKVGTETKADISNVTFADNDVVHADRVIALYPSYGKTLSNIRYLNDHAEAVGGDVKQRLIDITLQTTKQPFGNIKGAEINNFTAYQFSPKTSAITGSAGQTLDVSIQHLMIASQVRTTMDEAQIKTTNADVVFLPGS